MPASSTSRESGVVALEAADSERSASWKLKSLSILASIEVRVSVRLSKG